MGKPVLIDVLHHSVFRNFGGIFTAFFKQKISSKNLMINRGENPEREKIA
jgi:hypothetical protein